MLDNKTFDSVTKSSGIKQAYGIFAISSKEDATPSTERKYNEVKIQERIVTSIIRFLDEQFCGITFTPHNAVKSNKKNTLTYHAKAMVLLLAIGSAGYILPDKLIHKPMVVGQSFNEIQHESERINKEVSKVFFQNKNKIDELETTICNAAKANNRPYTNKEQRYVIESLSDKVINTTILFRAKNKSDNNPNNDNILDSTQRVLLQKEIDKALNEKANELLVELASKE